MTTMYAEALLESWMRYYYFDTEIDIGSSGVESFSLAELRELVGLTQSELDAIVFNDSRTLGADGLREAITQRWGNGDPEQVMATHGSSEAIYLVMNTLLKEGDEVIVVDPVYQQFYTLAESVGCRIKHWRFHDEQKFVPDVGELKSLLSAETRMVVVNFPHNPTGVSLTASQQEELINHVAETGAYLLWDSAFAEMTYGQPRLPEPWQKYERAISLGTLSKGFGLPGLRVGWLLAQPEVLESCVRLRDYLTLHLSPLVELIAQRAIEKADVLLNIRRQQARTNLEILSRWVEEHSEFVEWRRPDGGVCTFVRLRRVANTEAFCHRLAQQYKVLLVPGNCFNYPNYVRLGFGGATAKFKEGLSRLSDMLRVYV